MSPSELRHFSAEQTRPQILKSFKFKPFSLGDLNHRPGLDKTLGRYAHCVKTQGSILQVLRFNSISYCDFIFLLKGQKIFKSHISRGNKSHLVTLYFPPNCSSGGFTDTNGQLTLIHFAFSEPLWSLLSVPSRVS